ncbi:NADH-quinone oxidoreductase subunit J [Bdellovibrionota bacterium FG-1]
MTICWIFAVITLGAGAFAAFVGDIRRAILSLWIAGLGVGALYLTLGAELLAVIQWIVSTLVVISFVFFSVMFGEYGSSDWEKTGGSRIFKTVMAVLLGFAFSTVIWFGAGQIPENGIGLAVDGTDVAALGKTMTSQHLLSLEVLALTLFLVLIGGGVIARPEQSSKKESQP